MKISIYIHAQWDELDREYIFHPWAQDMSSQPQCGPLVGRLEVDFDPPPFDSLVNGQVDAYKKTQKNIRAEAERKCMEIQERIDKLLCLEHKPDAAHAD